MGKSKAIDSKYAASCCRISTASERHMKGSQQFRPAGQLLDVISYCGV